LKKKNNAHREKTPTTTVALFPVCACVDTILMSFAALGFVQKKKNTNPDSPK
jgi:hypothetical protein